MFNLLKDKTIIICENNNKISILKEITNSFLDIKFYTKKEFTESATQPHKAIRVSKNI